MIGAAVWGIAEAFFKSRADDETSILIANASRSAGHEEDARQDLAAATDGASERHPRFAVAGIAAMLGYVAVIPYVGFLIATFLLLLAIMLAAGYTRAAAGDVPSRSSVPSSSSSCSSASSTSRCRTEKAPSRS